MEAEKIAEFISHTQADPILAKQILQSNVIIIFFMSNLVKN